MSAGRTVRRVNVGVIGAGAMGASHLATLADEVGAANVVAVHDQDGARAAQLAQQVGADTVDSAAQLLQEVDAVVIASPDHTHADLAVQAIESGVFALVEKPLAPTAEEARRVVDAEVAAGRRFVQVGFNRRFDVEFQALKDLISGGALGTVRVLHGIHRNASNATSVDDSSLLTGSMIHEFDTFAWLLDDRIDGVRVESPITEGFRDPQLATLWTADGRMITVEVFVNAAYGYDVRVEAVGTGGAASIARADGIISTIGGARATVIGSDFVAHFADSYRRELAAWARNVLTGDVGGASAWDGYRASLVAEQAVESLRSGQRRAVPADQAPELYR